MTLGKALRGLAALIAIGATIASGWHFHERQAYANLKALGIRSIDDADMDVAAAEGEGAKIRVGEILAVAGKLTKASPSDLAWGSRFTDAHIIKTSDCYGGGRYFGMHCHVWVAESARIGSWSIAGETLGYAVGGAETIADDTFGELQVWQGDRNYTIIGMVAPSPEDIGFILAPVPDGRHAGAMIAVAEPGIWPAADLVAGLASAQLRTAMGWLTLAFVAGLLALIPTRNPREVRFSTVFLSKAVIPNLMLVSPAMAVTLLPAAIGKSFLIIALVATGIVAWLYHFFPVILDRDADGKPRPAR
ncbi:MAG: hypothetical protein JNL25_02195 [Rhodospirillaceae bacterium]|nr:hypothetical protein [Rhodospirillaceae bacterium]